MESLHDQIKGRCQHSTSGPKRGDPGDKCKADVEYRVLMKIDECGTAGCMLRLPCGGSTGETRGIKVTLCDKYLPVTEDMIQAEVDEWEEVERCLFVGISSCCKAPIDESQVIRTGQHKNHGPRFCSKCKKMVFRV